MQLMEKRSQCNELIGADELHPWLPTVAGFLSDTTYASAKELAQLSLICVTSYTSLTFTARISVKQMTEGGSPLIDILCPDCLTSLL